MEALRQYIFSVTAAAVICAVITHISTGAGKSSAIIKLLCGLFLTFAVIRPIADIQFEELSDYTLSISDDAQEAIHAGEDFASGALSAVIKQETEAYILDKASSLGADVGVDIVLDNDAIPKEVYLTGDISPYAKQKLQQFLSQELGIAKEYQIWIQ